MVDPSDSATSRSSVMPIDRTGSSSRSASEDTRWNPGLDSSGGPGTPTAINPATSSSSSANAATSSGALPRLATAATRGGRRYRPARARSHPVAGPRWPGPLRARLIDLPTGHQRGEPRHLVPLHRAEEVPNAVPQGRRQDRWQGRPDRCRPPWRGARWRSSPPCRSPQRRARAATASDAEPLGDRHRSDRTRVRARAVRSGLAPWPAAPRTRSGPSAVVTRRQTPSVRQIKRAWRPLSRRARWEK